MSDLINEIAAEVAHEYLTSTQDRSTQEWFALAILRYAQMNRPHTKRAGMTKRQADCLAFIQRERAAGRHPSMNDIAKGLSLRSKAGVHRLVVALEERGLVHRLPNRARSIEVIEVAA